MDLKKIWTFLYDTLPRYCYDLSQIVFVTLIISELDSAFSNASASLLLYSPNNQI